MRTGIKPIFIVLILVALLGPLYFIDVERHTSISLPWKNSASDASTRLSNSDLSSGYDYKADLENKPPKITIIVIWVTRTDTDPHYMAWFWQGVENNPNVNLLFVNIDVAGNGCKKYSSLKNVKVSSVCKNCPLGCLV